MFNIMSHQGNVANHTQKDGYNQKDKKITSVGKDAENLDSLYTASGEAKWCNCFGKQFGNSSKN